jgi:transposase-like protein
MNNLKIGSIVDLEVYPEICCELCDSIIHNHISCPFCKKTYAGTDQYGSLDDEKELSCEECGTKYKLISEYWYEKDACKAEIIKTGTIK